MNESIFLVEREDYKAFVERLKSEAIEVKENFSKEKLISGLTRGGIVLFGALLIACIISLLPEVLAAFGIATETALFESISVAAMAGVMGSTIVRYLGDAVKKLYAILGVKGEE